MTIDAGLLDALALPTQLDIQSGQLRTVLRRHDVLTRWLEYHLALRLLSNLYHVEQHFFPVLVQRLHTHRHTCSLQNFNRRSTAEHSV